MSAWQDAFLANHRLPQAYLQTAQRYFDPLVHELLGRRVPGRALVVGLNGSQGSGKSTLCAYLETALLEEHGLRAVSLSLDDFYLTLAEREELARRIHPLLLTRGVPGTHDLGLLLGTLEALQKRAGETFVPRFDKAMDDRAPASAWTELELPLDVILLEGWCLGAHAVEAQELAEPLNALEAEEDADGLWRSYSNDQLGRHYDALYDRIDCWVMLAAPAFEQVLQWRTEQEEKLRERTRGRGNGLMDGPALARFVAHFERHTRQCLADLPEKVDVLLQLDAGRNIIGVRGLEP